MSDIDLTDINYRWRWRRKTGPASIDEMMGISTAEMLPNGPFTNTLLIFEAVPFEFPPELEQYFSKGIPDPAPGAWYKGIPEKGDKYTDQWDDKTLLGTFWAKLWSPTPTIQGTLTILLFQYNFAVPNLIPRNNSGVRIFVGNLSKSGKYKPTFYGPGVDNYAVSTPSTFTLTRVGWDVVNNTNLDND